jgi:hypothetical protein
MYILTVSPGHFEEVFFNIATDSAFFVPGVLYVISLGLAIVAYRKFDIWRGVSQSKICFAAMHAAGVSLISPATNARSPPRLRSFLGFGLVVLLFSHSSGTSSSSSFELLSAESNKNK